MAEKPNMPFALLSFRLAIASFLLLGVFAAVPAVVLGHLALSSFKRDPGAYGGRNFAVWGIALGYLGIVASLVFIWFFFHSFLELTD